MNQLFLTFLFVIIAVALLWFGYTLLMGKKQGKTRKRRSRGISFPGDPQTCPVCSTKLNDGEVVKSLAFPSLSGGKDRFMHIKGCIYCLGGERDRVCPVCYNVLGEEEILICRLFERPHSLLQRPHVHVLGCTRCRG